MIVDDDAASCAPVEIASDPHTDPIVEQAAGENGSQMVLEGEQSTPPIDQAAPSSDAVAHTRSYMDSVLVYFDRVQFKGMRVNRTYPTIVGWSAELARKRVREENKVESFGRGTVLPRISKPADIAAATSRQNDQPPVAALNIPSSSVDKVAGILQKLASIVGEFGEAMAEIGKQGSPVNVMRKTFSGLSNMLNVASTIEATATPTSSQLDDIFFDCEHRDNKV
nr:uncharacterized protein LOC109158994 [Ipomoea batatas]